MQAGAVRLGHARRRAKHLNWKVRGPGSRDRRLRPLCMAAVLTIRHGRTAPKSHTTSLLCTVFPAPYPKSLILIYVLSITIIIT